MKIAFLPYNTDDTNSYLSIICKAIEEAYPNAELVALDISKKCAFPKNIDIYWLNWFESLPTGVISALMYLILKLIYLVKMKISKGKIVAVLHNKYPHEMRMRKLNLWFMRLYFRLSDKIIVLCDDSIPYLNQLLKQNIANKIYKISHPCYVCTPKRYDSINNKFTVLFFGQVRPYKNIELIIDVARVYSDIDFVIAGKPESPDFADELMNRACELSNVKFILKKLTDNEINLLMDNSSIMIFPYNLSSSLNSGAAMYAFSKGINVIMPKIGTIKDLKNSHMVFTYEYMNSFEHKQSLEKALQEAIIMYNSNYVEFVNRAITIRSEVLTYNSTREISRQIKSLLNNIT